MGTGPTDRIRGIAFLLSGVVAAVLIVYILVVPGSFASLHPLPLMLLLLLTMVVAFSQALGLLR
ncbi:hypothetical protein [Haloarchaeobius litoreus]|uniref:Uncharacterized protein n=1 Tax=Haloarchaeobius litoreus TaxID=755306 RepID=A0ABD6DRU7_9EURY|nr:hypothetical protein [Haloarchaeobius litoreus]